MKYWKQLYWIVIFMLLLIPLGNSVLSSTKNLTKSISVNHKRKILLEKLVKENNKINRKVTYYMSSDGQKSLVKEKLNKVEDGELLIKFDD